MDAEKIKAIFAQVPIEKLMSDRLWVLAGYFALVAANAKIPLGITDDIMTEILYAVLAFIIGKSLRGTSGGSILMPLLGKVIGTVEGKPGVEDAPGEEDEGASSR